MSVSWPCLHVFPDSWWWSNNPHLPLPWPTFNQSCFLLFWPQSPIGWVLSPTTVPSVDTDHLGNNLRQQSTLGTTSAGSWCLVILFDASVFPDKMRHRSGCKLRCNRPTLMTPSANDRCFERKLANWCQSAPVTTLLPLWLWGCYGSRWNSGWHLEGVGRFRQKHHQ